MGSSLSPTVFWGNAPPKSTSSAPFPCLTSQDQGPGPFIEPRCAYALRLHFLSEFEGVPLSGGPRVRISLPPAASPQTFGPAREIRVTPERSGDSHEGHIV